MLPGCAHKQRVRWVSWCGRPGITTAVHGVLPAACSGMFVQSRLLVGYAARASTLVGVSQLL